MSDKPLSSVPLELTTISETWLSTLSLNAITQHTCLPMNPTWKCVVNFEYKLIFTQLLSGSLMRDFYYEYLLAIGDRLIIIAWDNGMTSIKNVKAYEDFDIDGLKKLINRCSKLN